MRYKKIDEDGARPFVKWAGGKGQILEEIRRKYPAELGKKITKYAEPFVGGGAVLFDVLNKYAISEAYISDINRELIIAYTTIRDNVEELIRILNNIEQKYISADEEKRKILYYASRDRFNSLKLKHDNGIEISSLFIFLNKTCFNGLYRVNYSGLFNVPQGSYKNPLICDKENLRIISGKLKRVEIICEDYQLSRQFIDNKTFAYFDPPYRPLSITSSFTAYTKDGFSDKEQVELAKFIDEMSYRGACVVASNSDPKNLNSDDNFFDKLYQNHSIFRISATRAINAVSSGRGQIKELLITNY
ncbi:MAG: Dam family site-specific DNA-(adenine-N6)-methyltransferase [Desulfovibrio sp.]|jgi:DNA adenine methylase|nr:Dam family site-specific DNA-(adenine-N6)-methyltransferase [Desulfovibrio sp.]